MRTLTGDGLPYPGRPHDHCNPRRAPRESSESGAFSPARAKHAAILIHAAKKAPSFAVNLYGAIDRRRFKGPAVPLFVNWRQTSARFYGASRYYL